MNRGGSTWTEVVMSSRFAVSSARHPCPLYVGDPGLDRHLSTWELLIRMIWTVDLWEQIYGRLNWNNSSNKAALWTTKDGKWSFLNFARPKQNAKVQARQYSKQVKMRRYWPKIRIWLRTTSKKWNSKKMRQASQFWCLANFSTRKYFLLKPNYSLRSIPSDKWSTNSKCTLPRPIWLCSAERVLIVLRLVKEKNWSMSKSQYWK